MKYKLCLIIIFAALSLSAFADEKSFTPKPEITEQILHNTEIVNQKLIASMNKLLNNPATLTLDINYESAEKLSQGWIKRAFVHTSNGNVENLTLHKADIEFKNIQIDTTRLMEEEKIDPVKMEDINMDVVIREEDLNTFLKAKSKSIKVNNPKVELQKDRMELSGSTKYGMVKVEFWATGKLEIDTNGKEINFFAKKMKVNRMLMPRSFVGMIVKKINPVLTLDKFPFKLNLSEIRTEPGQITFTSDRKN